jgi:hypothetical protein
MRWIAVVAFALFLFATLAPAQAPTAGNVFLGYSCYNTNFANLGRAASTDGKELSKEGYSQPSEFWPT